MKKIILTITLALITNVMMGQLLDAASMAMKMMQGSSEEQMLLELKTINQKLSVGNKESVLTKMENIEQSKLLNIAEDYLWKVDSYLKQGKEIEEIYNKEDDIIQKMKEVQRVYRSNSKGNNYKELSSTINTTLNQTMNMVDLAFSLVSDDNYRLSSEERRQYLKEIKMELDAIDKILNQQLYVADKAKEIKEEQKEADKRRENFEKQLNK